MVAVKALESILYGIHSLQKYIIWKIHKNLRFQLHILIVIIITILFINDFDM